MKRNISGILLLDKPIGLSSNQALQVVKKMFSAKKAGHTGSLDPNACGMLPICFGESTKFSQFLLGADKRYIVTGKLGEVTASGDNEGPVIEKREVKNINADSFEKILPKFRGKISQIPPMYSAIKHHGQPLYKLARQGISVERSSREVNIYKLQLLEFVDNLATFIVHCSKGTYVRTLIGDIGEDLGCGAHVVALRRTVVGPYLEPQMVTLDELYELSVEKDYEGLDLFILPTDSMLLDMPELFLSSDLIHYMLLGQAVLVPNVPESGWVKLMDKEGKFLGVGEVTPDVKVAPKRMLRSF